MRELKFRVWDKRFKQFIDDKNYESDEIIFAWTPFGILSPKDYQNDIEIQQFTGLKDKNNKDIYEGDIIKLTMEIGPHCSFRDFKLSDAQKVGFGEVKWGSYSDGEYADDIECYMLNYDSLSELIYRTKRDFQPYIHAYEVVGNIFENKDLLI